MDALRTVPATLAWLRGRSWTYLLGMGYFALALGALGSVALPAGMSRYLHRALLAVPLLLIVAKDLAHLPDALARLRSAARERSGFATWLAALLPPELVGLLRLDRALWRGFMSWLRRRPYTARPDGLRLSYLERGAYTTIRAVILVATFTEVPLSALMLSLFVHDAGTRHLLHLLFGVGCAYTIVWVMGDRWLVGEGCHVLAGGELDLEVGARARARIPLAAIARVEPLKETRAAWCARQGLPVEKTLLVSPFDRPNVVLMLAPGHGIRLRHMGRERDGIDCIFLYLDRPELLAGAVRMAAAADTQE
jgi:hypothetical protein